MIIVKPLKLAGIVLAASFVASCADLDKLFSNPLPKNTPQVKATPAPTPTPVTAPVPTQLTLTMAEGGSTNPVGPEDLQDVVVNGVTIPASEIQFGSSDYSTQNTSQSEYEVTYEGAGKYYVVNTSTGKVLENRALIVFNLVNAKGSLIMPVLKGILDNNVKMTIDLSTGNIYGGITKADGTLDASKPVFKIGTDGKMTVTEPSGTQTVFSRNDANTTNLPEPETVVELSADEVQAQIGSVTSEVPATSAIAEYVGLWLYQGLGQKLIAQVKIAGASEFEASVTLSGELFTGTGSFNPTGKNDTLTLNVAKDNTVIELSKAGSNALIATLKSTSNTKAKTFVNVPFNAQRVRVTD